MPPTQVLISTGARLHFGLLSHGQADARQFGGAGLMIDRPGILLRASIADRDEFVCPAEFEPRLRATLGDYRKASASGSLSLPPVRLEIVQGLPMHVGLGSGTQLGMAVAKALSILSGEALNDPRELAARVGRGARSALGLHGFQQGGFLVEAGKRLSVPARPSAGAPISPLVSRVDFPEEWRFLLVRPEGVTGLSGSAEVLGFSRLVPMPPETTDRLCGLVLMHLLPAAIEGDFDAFSDSLYRFGHLVGEYFAPVQGGVYADPGMTRLAAAVRERGIQGVAQTSWGPTLCLLCPDESAAADLQAELTSSSTWGALQVDLVRPLNRGARIETGEAH